VSGHSRWATIKRTKGAADAKRGQAWTKVIKEVTIAARLGGGDPKANSRLRRAIDLGKSQNIPADTVTRAIKKGTGELEGVSYEDLVYEGVGPAGVLVLMEVVTDNRNRTAAEMRKLFDKHGGVLGAVGAASWAFDAKGVITVPAELATEEQIFEVAAGAGADDVKADGDVWTITTPRELLDTVRDALVTAKLEPKSAELQQLPKTPKLVEGDDARRMLSLLESLDDHDDVQKVFSEADFTDETLAALG
jgi:YebC/PmpR family DNA-binding regulatory protein